MKRLPLLGALLLLLLLTYAGERSLGPLPPLRLLLDPWVGAWQLARETPPTADLRRELPGLENPVEVRIDSRGVPHVFARSEADAWRAQGWLVARDRLFQMNLQMRATAGRLTEWVGSRAIGADRSSRRMGLARAAEAQWAAMAPDDPSRIAMEAYAEGVNAWIEAVGSDNLPFEYRLLGVRPDRWEPQYTMYLFQQMATVLAAQDVADLRVRASAFVGEAAAEALFPVHSPVQEPIQPNGQFAARIDPIRLPPPPAPGSTLPAAAQGADGLGGQAHSRAAVGDALGSNNWAVAASRSAGGHALLAGDPHLNLTLPSIWYEMHLVVPGTLDVAGATMAGSPGILIGFNRSLAWSVTNTGSDVLDFYREVVDDSLAPTRYRLDGEWQPLTLETAEYRDPRGTLIATDTLRFSHRGPLQPNGDGWRSTRWATQEVAPDVHAWLRLNRAADVNQGLAAVADYVGPAQNFILADSTGAIAIRSTGYYPVRAGDGRGDRILDGSTRASDWTGWIAPERYPQARNPAQGFLASANQEPVDPRTSAAYLGADWPSPWRAMRINTLLRSDSAVTPEAMRRFQTDPGSVLPDLVMPHLQAAAARFNADSTRPALHQGARLLAEWDHRYTLSSRRAVLFEQVLGALGRELWDEFIPAGDSLPEIVPGQDVMVALLQEPDDPWWDQRSTSDVEDRDQILARAIEAGLARTRARYGEPDDDRWLWGRIRTINIHHLLRLAPLSRLGIPVASGTGTLSPASGSGTHGASWRMVAEVGPQVAAQTTYPGGQSGNPVSRWYSDRLELWTTGDLSTAFFPPDPASMVPAEVAVSIRLGPGGGR